MNSDIVNRGPAPEAADAVVIFLHGRGASAESILSLYDELQLPGVAALAPQAAGGSWYPYSFLAPLENNQPWLNAALERVRMIVKDLTARGVPSNKIALLGFSQGACLVSEFAARNPRRYGAIMALTGGLIGPPGTARNYPGSLEGTPVFLGSSAPDPHVPEERVRETAEVFTRMGGVVDLRLYPGMPHVVTEEEIEVCEALIRAM